MKTSSRDNLPYRYKSAILHCIIITILLFLQMIISSGAAATVIRTVPEKGFSGGESELRGNFLSVELVGVGSYELAEIFHDILSRCPGVLEARRCRLHLDPHNPRASLVEWRIKHTGASVFALESSIYQRLKEISAAKPVVYPVNGSELTLTAGESESLQAIKPWQASGRKLRFIESLVFAADAGRIRFDGRRLANRLWGNNSQHGFE
ncbi:MAG: hypothetical protein JXR89_09040 [Deltaproteobacteria bacterium]|nr:hypothetical protein [Deltaproteobacteria bacterium]